MLLILLLFVWQALLLLQCTGGYCAQCSTIRLRILNMHVPHAVELDTSMFHRALLVSRTALRLQHVPGCGVVPQQYAQGPVPSAMLSMFVCVALP